MLYKLLRLNYKLLTRIFQLFATALSNLVHASDINYHLFANDIPNFCISKNFNEAMSARLSFHIHLDVCESAGFNANKTEFILISELQQLSKLNSDTLPLSSDISLTPIHLVRTLVAFGLILIGKLHPQCPQHLPILNWTIATLFIWVCP